MDERLMATEEELATNRAADVVVILVYEDGTRTVWGKRSRIEAERMAILSLTMREISGVALWDPATGARLYPWEE